VLSPEPSVTELVPDPLQDTDEKQKKVPCDVNVVLNTRSPLGRIV
jgi:hypothetical protein